MIKMSLTNKVILITVLCILFACSILFKMLKPVYLANERLNALSARVENNRINTSSYTSNRYNEIQLLDFPEVQQKILKSLDNTQVQVASFSQLDLEETGKKSLFSYTFKGEQQHLLIWYHKFENNFKYGKIEFTRLYSDQKDIDNLYMQLIFSIRNIDDE